MGIAGVACSAILFYISHFIIHSICPFCMAIYVLQVAIALTVGVTVARREQGVASALKRDLRELLPRPPAAAVLLPAVVLAAGGYILYPTIYDTTACPTETEEDLCTEPLTYGRPDARIKIVEYSDYECPFCSMTHFALRKAVDTYPGDVSLEHVHFPLDDACNPLLTRPFHENACEAARASICAERQDRFWDMNDWLYTHQKKIGDADWGDVAEEVGVDPERFLGCMDDPASLEVVERDIQRAAETTFVKQGSVGTPIIFINDRGHMGGINWRELQKYLVREFDLPPSPETEKR
jgi:glutaredoxin